MLGMTFFLDFIVAPLVQVVTIVLGGWLLDPTGVRTSWKDFLGGGSPELT
ncbi:hypothetical protein J433_15442 [Corynebacterium glutamicum MT]|uniref:Uncharacterized protein n=2 Tax=Corynebacterium glutamicum TaxID=1718 RepID=Q5KRP2_CORGT|nr:hypothetical protein C624_02835 [Corynebacterium glutamicum SCgG1]EGV39077.1 hypothetical protein CgS9114_14964 [Corynebacterium glutamicum S9114]EOA63184.1 hypothetical protein J433_15442 [Corynebacterium glutamicum MT]BAD84033.1 hypothetical protein [Corynebacterium glutamicum]BAF53522.1 hypothetical protein cgR_0554 [Corynebacterium glutamicum R]